MSRFYDSKNWLYFIFIYVLSNPSHLLQLLVIQWRITYLSSNTIVVTSSFPNLKHTCTLQDPLSYSAQVVEKQRSFLFEDDYSSFRHSFKTLKPCLVGRSRTWLILNWPASSKDRGTTLFCFFLKKIIYYIFFNKNNIVLFFFKKN